MTNAQRRRAAKAAAKVPGNAGTPHPLGNREYRRSPQGHEFIKLVLAKLAEKDAA